MLCHLLFSVLILLILGGMNEMRPTAAMESAISSGRSALAAPLPRVGSPQPFLSRILLLRRHMEDDPTAMHRKRTSSELRDVPGPLVRGRPLRREKREERYCPH